MIGKVITLGLGGFLLVHQQNILARQLGSLKNSIAKIETTMEIGNFARSLKQQAGLQQFETGAIHMPSDLSTWIGENFEAKTGHSPGVDRWGNNYQLEDRDGYWQIRCCGADSACYNADDIMQKVMSSTP